MAQDFDNPVISCTVEQLAFVAWQVSRSDFRTNGDTVDMLTIDLDMTNPSGVEFSVWWINGNPSPRVVGTQFSSIRDACWQAWRHARGGAEKYDETAHFAVWWAKILADMPQ